MSTTINTEPERKIEIVKATFNCGSSDKILQPHVGIPIRLKRLIFKDSKKSDLKSIDKLIYDKESIEFKYIVTRTISKYTCSIDPKKPALIQCKLCGDMFSSEAIFLKSWPEHMAKHIKNQQNQPTFNTKEQRETIQSTLTSHSSLPTVSDTHIEYIPIEEDAGKIIRIKLEPFMKKTHVSIGPAFYIEFKPILYHEQPVPRHLIELQSLPRKIRVMSYNVLAEIYATQGSYPTVEPHYIDWLYRRECIMTEVTKYEPDVVCFQEIESDHYETFWEKRMNQLGYEGRFKKKTKVIYTHTYKMDGCATFFLKDKFELLDKQEIEFKKLALEKIKAERIDHNPKVARLIQDNIALVLILRPKSYGPDFIVGNTHIMANPLLSDVKIWQVHTYLEKIYKISRNQIPVILAGDYNSVPNSGAYQLIIGKEVTRDHEDLKNNKSNWIFPTGRFTHNLDLFSAYRIYGQNRNSEPPYTTKCAMEDKFEGTLDYIFHSPTFKRIAFLDIPNLQETTYLPNGQFPSDHISLVADFALLN